MLYPPWAADKTSALLWAKEGTCPPEYPSPACPPPRCILKPAPAIPGCILMAAPAAKALAAPWAFKVASICFSAARIPPAPDSIFFIKAGSDWRILIISFSVSALSLDCLPIVRNAFAVWVVNLNSSDPSLPRVTKINIKPGPSRNLPNPFIMPFPHLFPAFSASFSSMPKNFDKSPRASPDITLLKEFNSLLATGSNVSFPNPAAILVKFCKPSFDKAAKVLFSSSFLNTASFVAEVELFNAAS